MLKNWTSHADYQHFISQALSSFDESQLKRLSYYSDPIEKLAEFFKISFLVILFVFPILPIVL